MMCHILRYLFEGTRQNHKRSALNFAVKVEIN